MNIKIKSMQLKTCDLTLPSKVYQTELYLNIYIELIMAKYRKKSKTIQGLGKNWLIFPCNLNVHVSNMISNISCSLAAVAQW